MELILLNAGSRSDLLSPEGSVVTIGVYDGVHLGHRHTLGRVVDAAQRSGRTPVVATFDRHPAEVVRPQSTPKMLTDLTQRLELFKSLGIQAVGVIPFNDETATEAPEEFIDSVLVRQLDAREVIVGEDFHFGKGRRGNVALLEAEGRRHGFEVTGVSLDAVQGEVVSSTRIRALVAAGDVLSAARFLGRVHELRGPISHGDGRGGPELGVPTANMHVEASMAVPAVGIYAGWYRDDEIGAHPAAISVGRRPTFYESAEPLIEAHLIGFEGDLYGRTARISFLERLRDEEHFDDLDALIAQMRRDIAVASDKCAEAADQAPGAEQGS